MKIYKFGGTSIGTVGGMKCVAELISESTPRIVVLSATAGITNHLEEIATNLLNHDIERAHGKITRMKFQFIDFVSRLLTDESVKREAIDYIPNRFRRLWQFINDELTSIEEKEVLAQGEFVSTALLHLYLRGRKITNILLFAFDFMHTGPEGEPGLKYIEEKLQAQLTQYPGINLLITQGYIYRNTYNEMDNPKRDGSDYTASLIGAAIYAEEIQIWTDVNGMHNNDPREVSGARSVKHLSFNEAEQLTFYGAKILHPFCIVPACRRNILVRLLSSMNPQVGGTLISDLQDGNIIRAIAAKDNILYVKFESKHCLCPYQFINKIFDAFTKHRTPLCLLVLSNQDVSVTIGDSRRLCKILAELKQYVKVLMEGHMPIISVVENMRWQYVGVEAQIMEILAGIPLRMISYGSNDSDVAFVIKAEDKKRALQALSGKLLGPGTDKVTG